jgi:hypothetical protein
METFIQDLNERGENVTHIHMNDAFFVVVTGSLQEIDVKIPPIPEFPKYPGPPVINLEQLLWTNQIKQLCKSVSGSTWNFLKKLWPV